MMTLTNTNLFVLARIFEKGETAPNATPAVSMPHLRRCMKLGLVVVEGKQLRLTNAGKVQVDLYRANPDETLEWNEKTAAAWKDSVDTVLTALLNARGFAISNGADQTLVNELTAAIAQRKAGK